jgi:clan AA aspartic protease (TIGR02281 family)
LHEELGCIAPNALSTLRGRHRLCGEFEVVMKRTMLIVGIVAVIAITPKAHLNYAGGRQLRVPVELNLRVNASALLDTGATSAFSLCQSMADELGLMGGAPVILRTLSGVIEAREANVDFLRVGGIQLENVRILIKPDSEFCEPIIGLEFVHHLGFMVVAGNVLALGGKRPWWF